MPKVLIAEDDAPLREVMARMLEGAGFEVVVAANGRKAVAAVMLDHPDLVVTDILMPETDGFELIAAIRKVKPETPIIAMSGNQMNSALHLRTAAQLGVAAALQKP